MMMAYFLHDFYRISRLYPLRKSRDYLYGITQYLVLRIKKYFRVKPYERNSKENIWAMADFGGSFKKAKYSTVLLFFVNVFRNCFRDYHYSIDSDKISPKHLYGEILVCIMRLSKSVKIFWRSMTVLVIYLTISIKQAQYLKRLWSHQSIFQKTCNRSVNIAIKIKGVIFQTANYSEISDRNVPVSTFSKARFNDNSTNEHYDKISIRIFALMEGHHLQGMNK